jgi:hypothetical protein
MGAAAVDAGQIVAWFNANKPPDGPYLTVSIDELASYFIQEGADEGVTGDIAFVQSVVETGWFRYGGQVQWWQNNFAGLGAEDGGAQGASFADARTGARAQIQHLRAYADPNATSCAVPPLHHDCVDPRFNLVSPKGKAPSWNQLGNGNWALDPNYAATILNTYNSLRQFNGLPPV